MKQKFYVEGMTCASCVNHVDSCVRHIDGVEDVSVSLLTNSMEVSFNDENLTIQIIREVKKAGYNAYIDKKELVKKDYSLLYLIITGILLILVMIISMGPMINLPLPQFLLGKENALNYSLIQFILVLPIIVIYRRFYISGFSKLFKGKPNMDSLIAIGSTASMLYGIFAIIMIIIGLVNNDFVLVSKYHENLYFESAGMILVLVSFGKFLENKSKNKTTEAISKLMDLAPKKAIILINEIEQEIDIEDVKVDDVLIIKKGEQVPVDGVIVFGNASIDQSNITGESLPISKGIDEDVFSSTIVTSGYIKIKATKVGEDTSLNNIIRLVKEASDSKAPISKFADKVAGIFVPIVIMIALITFIVHFIISLDFEISFSFAISVLVVACPCALGLATPVAIMVGTGKGAQLGLLIKNAEILEKVQYIKTIVLDKTGTLTEGKPQVTDVISNNQELLSIAYSLELYSEHPLAEAIVTYCENNNIKSKGVNEFVSIEGKGIRGKINDKNYFAGNIFLLKELNLYSKEIENKLNELSLENKTPLLFMSEDDLLGIIAVKDKLKKSSVEAIKELKKLGIEIVMLTGDNSVVAHKIAEEVDINRVYAEILPQDKQMIINKLKKDGSHLVGMVGDGVNDALALTSADLGIAIGVGSDIAKESSDIILLRNDLLDVKNIILLSKKVFLTIKINLFWAFFYNSIGIILATGVFSYWGIYLNPMISSLMMSLSSVFVVLNALTINLFKVKREEIKMKEIILNVEGMMCKHCVKHVNDALLSINGVISVEVSLENKTAKVIYKDYVDVSLLINEVEKIGYACSK